VLEGGNAGILCVVTSHLRGVALLVIRGVELQDEEYGRGCGSDEVVGHS